MPSHPVQPPEWIDSAPILVEESIEIAAGPDDVWLHIADHERWPDWFSTIKKVERVGSGEGVGSGRRVTIKGPAIVLVEEFIAWRPGAEFAFAVTETKVPILHTVIEQVLLEPVGDASCRLTYRQGIELRRGFGGLGSLVKRQMSSHVRSALANLEHLVETQA